MINVITGNSNTKLDQVISTLNEYLDQLIADGYNKTMIVDNLLKLALEGDISGFFLMTYLFADKSDKILKKFHKTSNKIDSLNLNTYEQKHFLDSVILFLHSRTDRGYNDAITKWEKISGIEQETIVEKLFDDDKAIIRIAIDGSWDLLNLQSFSKNVIELYGGLLELYLISDYNIRTSNNWLYKGGREYQALTSLTNLKINQIHYSSPGNIDLIGIKALLEFLAKILNKAIFLKSEIKVEKLKKMDEEIEFVLRIKEKLSNPLLSEDERLKYVQMVEEITGVTNALVESETVTNATVLSNNLN